MAAPIRPASAKAFKREKWLWVPAIADITAPTVAELAAATGLDISCYLFDSTARPSKNTNAVTKERRICDGEQYEQIGITTYSGGELTYAVDPQAVAGSDGKKAWEKFVAGATGFLVRRLAIDVDTDVAAGQFVDTMPAEVGPSMPTLVGEGEAAEVAGSATYVITGPPAWIKAVVA